MAPRIPPERVSAPLLEYDQPDAALFPGLLPRVRAVPERVRVDGDLVLEVPDLVCDVPDLVRLDGDLDLVRA